MPSWLAYFSLVGAALAASAADWRSKSIYQVVTDRFARTDGSTTASCDTSAQLYCGGSWQGLIDKLDYIQNMGFTAVWISPITKNIEQDTGYGYAYHGYWQQDLYSLNEHFGTQDDLWALSEALHDRNMYLMVDIVVNHFGWDGSASTVDYSQFNPFHSESYFHDYCVPDYENQTSVEDCWLGDSTVELPDLRTEDPDVYDIYYSWIQALVSDYAIDGLRLDTAKNVDKPFWPPFNDEAGVFCTGEVFDGDPAYTCPYQDYLDSVLNYPVYFQLVDAFSSTSGSISNLVDMLNEVKSECADSTVLGSFSENHDNPRFASLTSDLSLAKNVITYTILADGVPIIYYGQEQRESGSADPNNREALWLTDYNTDAPLYQLIAGLNQVRNYALYKDPDYLTYQNYPIYSDTTTVAMRKGYDGYQVITVLSNKGTSGSSYTLTLGSTGFTSGEKVVEMLTCTSVTVDSSGNIAVPMASGLPRVYYPAAQLTGSGICSY